MNNLVTKSPCKHIEIAHSSLGEVLVCADCGVVHVSMQSVSMRFDMEAFQVVAQMMTKAQVVLAQASSAKQDENILKDIQTYDRVHVNANQKMH